MAHAVIPKFQNDMGVDIVELGAKEFECIGAKPPFDHPHIYLDMGSDNEIICPYCSTVYRYKSDLAADQSRPTDALYKEYVEG
ncbi:putative Zn-finger protein [Rhodoligotrophos appendicifer]|uniref:zinc-finger domain-containing protein n=1 Tax=Rhodoligotrophos appendicifer TaxID=987056 RepID=UPI001185C183|nr:zinc-finger domain-containing protein [Rhodoligotrophos appendicifer]